MPDYSSIAISTSVAKGFRAWDRDTVLLADFLPAWQDLPFHGHWPDAFNMPPFVREGINPSF
jgi:hypothetical protein